MRRETYSRSQEPIIECGAYDTWSINSIPMTTKQTVTVHTRMDQHVDNAFLTCATSVSVDFLEVSKIASVMLTGAADRMERDELAVRAAGRPIEIRRFSTSKNPHTAWGVMFGRSPKSLHGASISGHRTAIPRPCFSITSTSGEMIAAPQR